MATVKELMEKLDCTEEEALQIIADDEEIEHVDASFALTRRSKDAVGISARSMGNVNVQVIMEKLGGGGHLSNAATQLKGITIEEAKVKLLGAINDYLKENE